MNRKKDSSAPRERVEKLKTGAGAASKFVLVVIVAFVLSLIALVAYWTQIEGKDLPVKVDADVEESPQGVD